jgi:hypothetical protein
VTHTPIASKLTAAPTANIASSSAGSAMRTLRVSRATPAVDVRTSHGVTIGTAVRALAGRRAGYAAHTVPITSTSNGNRISNDTGRSGPVTSTATAPPTAAAVIIARTQRLGPAAG